MTEFILLTTVLAALMPALLVRHKNIVRKQLFILSYFWGIWKPLSFFIVPIIFSNTYSPALDTYFILQLIYYLCAFLIYYFALKIIPQYNFVIHDKLYQKSPVFRWVGLLACIALFSILIFKSNGVFLFNPRHGYQYHREGVGYVWALYIFFVGIAYYFYMILKPASFTKAILFTGLMFLTGSKQLILEVFFKTFLVFQYREIEIKKWQLAVGFILVILLFLRLFDQFGASESFFVRMKSYYTFMYYAGLVFEDYARGQFEFFYGEIFASSFWSYIPRALVPEKPWAYGQTLLLENYFPGMAATGHTPSFGPLTAEFADFGFWGVLLAFFNLDLLLKIFCLVLVCSAAKASKVIQVGALAYVLVPGFGFHLPAPLTFFFAFVILPAVISRVRSSNG